MKATATIILSFAMFFMALNAFGQGQQSISISVEELQLPRDFAFPAWSDPGLGEWRRSSSVEKGSAFIYSRVGGADNNHSAVFLSSVTGLPVAMTAAEEATFQNRYLYWYNEFDSETKTFQAMRSLDNGGNIFHVWDSNGVLLFADSMSHDPHDGIYRRLGEWDLKFHFGGLQLGAGYFSQTVEVFAGKQRLAQHVMFEEGVDTLEFDTTFSSSNFVGPGGGKDWTHVNSIDVTKLADSTVLVVNPITKVAYKKGKAVSQFFLQNFSSLGGDTLWVRGDTICIDFPDFLVGTTLRHMSRAMIFDPVLEIGNQTFAQVSKINPLNRGNILVDTLLSGPHDFMWVYEEQQPEGLDWAYFYAWNNNVQQSPVLVPGASGISLYRFNLTTSDVVKIAEIPSGTYGEAMGGGQMMFSSIPRNPVLSIATLDSVFAHATFIGTPGISDVTNNYAFDEEHPQLVGFKDGQQVYKEWSQNGGMYRTRAYDPESFPNPGFTVACTDTAGTVELSLVGSHGQHPVMIEWSQEGGADTTATLSPVYAGDYIAWYKHHSKDQNLWFLTEPFRIEDVKQCPVSQLPKDTTSVVENVEQLTSFTIYPNPATNTLRVDGENMEKVSIFSMSGQLVMSEQFAQNMTMDVSPLVPGMYIVQGQGIDGSVSIKKLIKQ